MRNAWRRRNRRRNWDPLVNDMQRGLVWISIKASQGSGDGWQLTLMRMQCRGSGFCQRPIGIDAQAFVTVPYNLNP